MKDQGKINKIKKELDLLGIAAKVDYDSLSFKNQYYIIFQNENDLYLFKIANTLWTGLTTIELVVDEIVCLL